VAGNVRELRNLIERIVILNRRSVWTLAIFRSVALAHGPNAPPTDSGVCRGAGGRRREYIQKKLKKRSNVTGRRKCWALERSNLYRKMKTLGIAPKE